MQLHPVGVYPVPEAPDPCHLVELELHAPGVFDATTITQPTDGPPGDWQIALDVYLLAPAGDSGRPLLASDELRAIAAPARIAFFFHYLQLDRPLVTASGPVWLPAPAPRPPRLGFVVYDRPAP